MDDAVDREDPAESYRQNEEIERNVVGQRDQPEQIAPRHPLDAVLAAGELGLQREEIDHLREGERDHGEVDPLPPDRQRADGEPQKTRMLASSAAAGIMSTTLP